MLHAITVSEVRSETFAVEAESAEEARRLVMDAFSEGCRPQLSTACDLDVEAAGELAGARGFDAACEEDDADAFEVFAPGGVLRAEAAGEGEIALSLTAPSGATMPLGTLHVGEGAVPCLAAALVKLAVPTPRGVIVADASFSDRSAGYYGVALDVVRPDGTSGQLAYAEAVAGEAERELYKTGFWCELWDGSGEEAAVALDYDLEGDGVAYAEQDPAIARLAEAFDDAAL